MLYSKGTFIVVPNITHLKGLPVGAQALFMWLCTYADDEGVCFPSRSLLAKNIGASTKSVDRHIETLEVVGLLEKSKRRRPGDVVNKSNLYQILIPEQVDKKAELVDTSVHQQVDKNDPVTIPIYNYTQVTIQDENQSTDSVLPPVPEIKVIIGQLPINRGSTPIQRLKSIYNQLYLDKYGFLPSLDMLKVGGSIDSMLKTRSEFQVAAMMVVYFNWRGMDGSDDFAEKRLVNASHPFSWLPSSMNTHETYLRNVQRLDFDNNDEVAKFVRDYMIKIKK